MKLNNKGMSLLQTMVAMAITGMVMMFSTDIITGGQKNLAGLDRKMAAINYQRTIYSVLADGNNCHDYLKDLNGDPAKYRVYTDPSGNDVLESTIYSIEKTVSGTTTFLAKEDETYGRLDIVSIELPMFIDMQDAGSSESIYTVPLEVRLNLNNPGVGGKEKTVEVIMNIRSDNNTGDIISCNSISSGAGAGAGSSFDPEEACNLHTDTTWNESLGRCVGRAVLRTLSSGGAAQPGEIFIVQ